MHANTESSISNLLMEVAGTYTDADTRCCIYVAQRCILLLQKLMLRLNSPYLMR